MKKITYQATKNIIHDTTKPIDNRQNILWKISGEYDDVLVQGQNTLASIKKIEIPKSIMLKGVINMHVFSNDDPPLQVKCVNEHGTAYQAVPLFLVPILKKIEWSIQNLVIDGEIKIMQDDLFSVDKEQPIVWEFVHPHSSVSLKISNDGYCAQTNSLRAPTYAIGGMFNLTGTLSDIAPLYASVVRNCEVNKIDIHYCRKVDDKRQEIIGDDHVIKTDLLTWIRGGYVKVCVRFGETLLTYASYHVNYFDIKSRQLDLSFILCDDAL